MPRPLIAGLAATLLLGACQSITDNEKALMAEPVDCSRAQEQIAGLQAIRPGPGRQFRAAASTLGAVGLAVGVATDDIDNRAEIASGRYGEAVDARIAEIRETCALPAG